MLTSLRRALRRFAYGEPVVVVSGLPRSGTSMAMKMLEAGGVAPVTDGQRTADEDNPKGYYEDERVKDLANQTDRRWLRMARGQAIKVITHLLRELPASNNYKVLLMHRKLEEIVASQNKMLDRRGEAAGTDDDRAVELLERDLWRARYLLRHRACFESLDINYRDVLEQPEQQARRICAFLARPMDVEKMAEVVDPNLYRNRR
jgi:hypothetical protein